MRHHWLAIASALWFLAGEAATEWGVAAAALEPTPDPVAPCVGVHDCIVADLQRANPVLAQARAARIADAVTRYSDEYALPPDLVVAVMVVESSVRPSARSPKGAIGLMQVMPHMFAQLGLAGNIAHIETNVEAGCILLADNIRRLGEDDGILAYNGGSSVRVYAYLERVRRVRRTLLTRSGLGEAAGPDSLLSRGRLEESRDPA